MLMHVHFPLEPFNTTVRDGTAGENIQRILEAIKPEAAYFSEQDGKRGATLVVNVDTPSDVPALAERARLQWLIGPGRDHLRPGEMATILRQLEDRAAEGAEGDRPWRT